MYFQNINQKVPIIIATVEIIIVDTLTIKFFSTRESIKDNPPNVMPAIVKTNVFVMTSIRDIVDKVMNTIPDIIKYLLVFRALFYPLLGLREIFSP